MTGPDSSSGKPKTLIEGQVIHLLPFIGGANTARNVTFRDCQIIGPAVISPINCSLTFSTFEGTKESIAIRVIEGDPVLAGSVVAENCVFDRCTFRRITIAATDPLYALLTGLPQVEAVA